MAQVYTRPFVTTIGIYIMFNTVKFLVRFVLSSGIFEVRRPFFDTLSFSQNRLLCRPHTKLDTVLHPS